MRLGVTEPVIKDFIVEEAVGHAEMARNTTLTYGGRSCAEILKGNAPIDNVFHNENYNPAQLIDHDNESVSLAD